MGAARCPGQIDDPDPGPPLVDPAAGVSVERGLDTDADGRPDTVLDADGVDLVLLTDLDGDGYADRVLRIGPDGVARELGHRPTAPPDSPLDVLPGGWFEE